MVNIPSGDIIKAAKILNLGETATMDKIKKNYKDLMIKWHPDQCQEKPAKCKEMTQQINQAYEIILNYCRNYTYSFREEDIKRLNPGNYEEWWHERFGDDPIWGK